MKINVHAGHNPDGKKACGAIGLIKESTEARKVKNLVISKLQSLGHTVYDCTVDDGLSATDVLQKIVAKCNAHSVDLDVSIHFNSGAKDSKGNSRTKGTEVFVYNDASKAKKYASDICKAIVALGYTDRGVKTNQGLYVLRKTNSPALLIECCFVDDADDINLYNPETIATAIVQGITGSEIAIESEINIESIEIAKGDPQQFSQIVKNIKTALNNDYGLKFAINDTIDNVLMTNLGNVVLSTTSYKNNITYVLTQLLAWWGYILQISDVYSNSVKNVIYTFQNQTGLQQTGTTTKEVWYKLLGK